MLFGTHLLMGATIGTLVPETGSASGLAVLSHYVLDHIPHWNYLPRYRSRWEDTWKMALEPLITVPLFLLLAWYFGWGIRILIPAFAATVPDLIEGAQFLLRTRLLRWHSRWHHWGHWHAPFWPSLPILLSLLAIFSLILPWR